MNEKFTIWVLFVLIGAALSFAVSGWVYGGVWLGQNISWWVGVPVLSTLVFAIIPLTDPNV